MPKGTVYLMRGLPSCGKSHTAREIAGADGVVCETDAYFYTEVGDDAGRYDYRRDLLGEARRWAFDRFVNALERQVPRVVVDRGNGLSLDTRVFATAAVDHGYEVELAEPRSPWWQEIRVLLKYKRYTRPILHEWSEALAVLSRRTHRVPASNIRRRMAGWKHDLTVEDILAFHPGRSGPPSRARAAARPLRTQSTMAVSAEMGSLVLGGSVLAPRRQEERTAGAEASGNGHRRTTAHGGREMWIFDEDSGGFGLVSDPDVETGMASEGPPGGIDIDDDAGEEFVVIEKAPAASGEDKAGERSANVEWHAGAAPGPLPKGAPSR